MSRVALVQHLTDISCAVIDQSDIRLFTVTSFDRGLPIHSLCLKLAFGQHFSAQSAGINSLKKELTHQIDRIDYRNDNHKKLLCEGYARIKVIASPATHRLTTGGGGTWHLKVIPRGIRLSTTPFWRH
jgi:hypothetical protein